MNKFSSVLFIIFLISLVGAVIVAYDRYMKKEDFVYFLTEEEIPDVFDFGIYK